MFEDAFVDPWPVVMPLRWYAQFENVTVDEDKAFVLPWND